MFPQVAIRAQSCDRVSEIARQYQAQKNALSKENDNLHRNLANVSNDDLDNSNGNNSHESAHRSKRQRTQVTRNSTPTDLDDETLDDAHYDEIVSNLGHKFCIIYSLWVHNGGDIFMVKVDDTYDATERFENERNKLQGQLQEIIGLLEERLDPDIVLHQKWVRREV